MSRYSRTCPRSTNRCRQNPKRYCARSWKTTFPPGLLWFAALPHCLHRPSREESTHTFPIGLHNHIVISTKDAVLIADKKYSHEIKALVNTLKSTDHSTTLQHQKTFFTWGSRETLLSDPSYQMNRIILNPNTHFSTDCTSPTHWLIISGSIHLTTQEQTLHFTQHDHIQLDNHIIYKIENQNECSIFG